MGVLDTFPGAKAPAPAPAPTVVPTSEDKGIPAWVYVLVILVIVGGFAALWHLKVT